MPDKTNTGIAFTVRIVSRTTCLTRLIAVANSRDSENYFLRIFWVEIIGAKRHIDFFTFIASESSFGAHDFVILIDISRKFKILLLVKNARINNQCLKCNYSLKI